MGYYGGVLDIVREWWALWGSVEHCAGMFGIVGEF